MVDVHSYAKYRSVDKVIAESALVVSKLTSITLLLFVNLSSAPIHKKVNLDFISSNPIKLVATQTKVVLICILKWYAAQ